MLTTLDAAAVRRWSAAAAAALAMHQAEIDDLNVFPVPDGDTGTNLAITLQAAADALAAAPASTATAALQAMARGAVLEARGNAGVIVSQILRGLADGTPDADCDGVGLAAGLQMATRHAYAAVADPVEGTMLSVLQAAAQAAERAPGGLSEVVRAATDAAGDALSRTTAQLPALARAGVVDAGGRGLQVLLAALAAVVSGADDDVPAVRRAARGRAALHAEREAGSDRYGYEVQYLLEAPDDTSEQLRDRLSAMGDCVVVAGTGDGLWKVHVHVDDVGAAIEVGVETGRLSRITVIRFDDQIAADEALAPPGVTPTRRGVAVVAVVPGKALAQLFAAEGVHVVAGDEPADTDVLSALLGTGAAQVTLLPNAGEVSPVVEAAAQRAREAGLEVAVVPTRSPVQGLAAVAVHDPDRRFGEDVIAMAEAAAATRWAELLVAEREALTSVGRCAPGDVLGLITGEVVEIGHRLAEVGRAVIDRLLGSGGERLTILGGVEADPHDVAAVRAHLEANHPLVEVSVFAGGQSRYPLLIGVE